MCGIAGIIGRLDEANRAALERMSNAMVHRGPDACGTWVSTPDARGWGALLAHRRLSILDLSPAGAQPMVDPVTGHVVVLNGEIYNFGDLRRRLEAEGQEFQSTGDTAVSGDEKTIAWHFRPNASAYIVGLLAKEVHFDQLGAAVAGTRFRYDLQPTWDTMPLKGHATETERWINLEDRWTLAATRYDAWGNVILARDATNRERTTTFDSLVRSDGQMRRIVDAASARTVSRMPAASGP